MKMMKPTLNFWLALLGIAAIVVVFMLLATLPVPARADDEANPVRPEMHFLVLLGLKDKSIRPMVQATLPDAEDCWKAARRANANEPRMEMPDWQAAGARYGCMRIVPEML